MTLSRTQSLPLLRRHILQHTGCQDVTLQLPPKVRQQGHGRSIPDVRVLLQRLGIKDPPSDLVAECGLSDEDIRTIKEGTDRDLKGIDLRVAKSLLQALTPAHYPAVATLALKCPAIRIDVFRMIFGEVTIKKGDVSEECKHILIKSLRREADSLLMGDGGKETWAALANECPQWLQRMCVEHFWLKSIAGGKVWLHLRQALLAFPQKLIGEVSDEISKRSVLLNKEMKNNRWLAQGAGVEKLENISPFSLPVTNGKFGSQLVAYFNAARSPEQKAHAAQQFEDWLRKETSVADWSNSFRIVQTLGSLTTKKFSETHGKVIVDLLVRRVNEVATEGVNFDFLTELTKLRRNAKELDSALLRGMLEYSGQISNDEMKRFLKEWG